MSLPTQDATTELLRRPALLSWLWSVMGRRILTRPIAKPIRIAMLRTKSDTSYSKLASVSKWGGSTNQHHETMFEFAQTNATIADAMETVADEPLCSVESAAALALTTLVLPTASTPCPSNPVSSCNRQCSRRHYPNTSCDRGCMLRVRCTR